MRFCIISQDHHSWPVIQALYDRKGTRRRHPCSMDIFLVYINDLPGKTRSRYDCSPMIRPFTWQVPAYKKLNYFSSTLIDFMNGNCSRTCSTRVNVISHTWLELDLQSRVSNCAWSDFSQLEALSICHRNQTLRKHAYSNISKILPPKT